MCSCKECLYCLKPITYENSYRCRICKDYFCEECSLEHFGLVEVDGEVRYKNIFKTMLWLIRKRLFNR